MVLVFRVTALVVLVAVAVVFLPACGDSSPAASSPTAAVGAIASVTGRVLTTVGGAPIAGARVTSGGSNATTASDGSFSLSLPMGSVAEVRVSAAEHVTRRSFLSPEGPAPILDIIEPSPLWSLTFYRELARNGAGGGNLLALNPWTVEPAFYIDRRPEQGTGREIPDTAVATVVEAIETVLPLLTGGRLGGGRIETGDRPPADETEGTVVIRWNPIEVAQVSGPAAAFTRGVGGNASVVVLRTVSETESIYHELGHVLGLWHPLGGVRPSHMLFNGNPRRPHFTDWDVFHSRIVYARPAGNTDIDEDPRGYLLNGMPLTSSRSRTSVPARAVVVCRPPQQ